MNMEGLEKKWLYQNTLELHVFFESLLKEEVGVTWIHLGCVLLDLSRNRNSWNKPNNCLFSGYSHSRVAVKPS